LCYHSRAMSVTPIPLSASQGPRIPERVGRYEILMPIASGGMATVYLARPTGAIRGVNRDVALKLTHAHLRKEKEFAHHLVEEAKLAAGIHHPNVVAILDVGDDPLGIYLVMDYVDGDTLHNLSHQAQKDVSGLSLAAGLRVVLDGLAGLHAAHELSGPDGTSVGLVHRDFTPQNILVGLDGVSRLSDFGIAKAATRLGHTATGVVKGKIAYMSPEHARGRPLDRRADVFSAGVVAWEVVAGRRLRDSDTDVSLLLRVATEPAPSLAQIVPDIPPDVDRAIASALVLDRDHRCPTAQVFFDQLKTAAEAAGLLAGHEDVAREVRRILGAKLDRRQQRLQESLARRSRRAGSASAELEAATTTILQPSSGPWSSLHTPLPADALVGSDATQIPSGQVATAENLATDSVLVQPSASSARPAAARLGIAVALGALVASLIIVPILLLRSGPSGSSGHEQPSASATLPPVPPPPSAEIPPPSPSVATTTSSTRQVTVTANAKIKCLVLGSEDHPVVEPSVSLTIEVTKDGAETLRGHATAADGRTAKIRLEPGQVRMKIWFPPRGSPHIDPGTADTSPPLAPNPYGK
jgi:serine/threonine protein kinase